MPIIDIKFLAVASAVAGTVVGTVVDPVAEIVVGAVAGVMDGTVAGTPRYSLVTLGKRRQSDPQDLAESASSMQVTYPTSEKKTAVS